MKQILWEWGFWRILLQARVSPADDMYYDIVSTACPNFALEKPALQEMVEARDHYLHLLRGHPELTGVGMEYGWGCLKQIIQA